jgi:hypothetical protein
MDPIFEQFARARVKAHVLNMEKTNNNFQKVVKITFTDLTKTNKHTHTHTHTET